MARILLAEDEHNIRIIVEGILTRQGHEVHAVADGAEAWECFQKRSFDLLITDMIMPEMNGIDLIVKVHRAAPDLKIIAMSGGDRIDATHYLKLAREQGAEETILKPFNKDDLVGAVNELLAAVETN